MVPVCIYPAGRAIRHSYRRRKKRRLFFLCGKGFPCGGSCQRPRPLTDEGQVCHGNPGTGNRGELAPHPALRATFPLRGRHF